MGNDTLRLTSTWPVDHVAAAVVAPSSPPRTVGDQHHRFALASLTKPLTAWATLVAVEEGSVALDDPVGQPGCTLRHLLAHAGGYPFEGSEPVSAPERTRIYSNTGFDLVAAHVAESSGIGFAEYLDAAVLRPLGMTTTALNGSAAHAAVSTCADVCRFVAELLRPTLLHTSTVDDALLPQYPDLSGIVPGVGRFSPCPWGLGMEIAGAKAPHWTGRRRSARTFGHFGGAGTMMWVDPVADIGVVALTDRPFEQWASEAIERWGALSDAVLDDAVRDEGTA